MLLAEVALASDGVARDGAQLFVSVASLVSLSAYGSIALAAWLEYWLGLRDDAEMDVEADSQV